MPPSPRPRMPPYLLMLVVSFALLGLIGYQTFKDRSISGDLLQQNQALQELLKKEEKKIRELQEDFTRLSTQKEQLNGLKDGLSGQLIELKRGKSLTEEGTKELESSLEFKEKEVKDLREKLALLDKTEQEIEFMKKEMMQQDEEIRVLKAQIEAFGMHLSEQLHGEFTNGTVSAMSDEKDSLGEKETSKEKPLSSGQKASEKEGDALKIDEEDPAVDAAMAEEHTEMSKEKSHTQDEEPEDEESTVDDGEENLANETGDDGDDAEKNHDEDDTDEQHDIGLHAVNKFDPDENEMVSME